MSLRIFILSVGVVAAAVAVLYQIYFTIQLSTVLHTTSGDIQGVILKSRNGRNFTAYYGIPYAKPPIGSRRFQAPERLEKWTGIFDGTFHRPACKQFDFSVTGRVSGSEDCLYLNVFVPNTSKSGKGLPVMVDLHGGYFHLGGTRTQGANYFMDHDVIVVTIAYRLGVLGFLNTGDGLVRGNMGLKDQNLGLEWIQKNIRSFGGDPSRVTLLGESAGSTSVHYHMISPKSNNLFSRAIRQSGTALNYWIMMGKEQNIKQQAIEFARRVNCPVDNPNAMVSCLQNMDADLLVSGHSDLMRYPMPQHSKFGPSIETVEDEDSFLTEHPMDLIKSGNFQKRPLLSGFNMDEGLLYSAVLSVNETKLNEAIDDWFRWAPQAFYYPENRKDISQQIFDFYFTPYVQNFKKRSEWIQNFTNAYGDRVFIYGITQSHMHEQKYLDEMYSYVYDHYGGFSLGTVVSCSELSIISILWKILKSLILNRMFGIDPEINIPGTSHGDEMALLWDSVYSRIFFSHTKDFQLSKDLVKLWVDFATGVQPLKFVNTVIPKSTADQNQLQFIRLASDTQKIIQHPFQDRMNFWETLKL